MVRLHKKFIEESNDLQRTKAFFNEKITHCVFTEDVLLAMNSSDRKIRSSAINHNNPRSCWAKTQDCWLWLWYCRVRGPLMIALGIIFSLASIIVLYAEFTNIIDFQFSLLHGFVYDGNDDYFSIIYTCAIPLAYLCAATSFGLLKLKVLNIYRLHPNRQSDSYCLLYSAM